MSAQNKNPDSLATPAVTQALESLKTYDTGSGRGMLLALDMAVAEAGTKPEMRAQLETKLLAALHTCSSLPAREYICSKLVVLGSAVSVPVLAQLLEEPGLVTAACNALQANPSPKAGKALREALERLPKSGKIAALNSLALRRDPDAVTALTRLLQAPDPDLATAAAAALGEIGSRKSGENLMKFQSKAPASLRPALADSLLTCAERLRSLGRTAEAETIYRSVLSAQHYPAHVHEAARRGLARH